MHNVTSVGLIIVSYSTLKWSDLPSFAFGGLQQLQQAKTVQQLQQAKTVQKIHHEQGENTRAWALKKNTQNKKPQTNQTPTLHITPKLEKTLNMYTLIMDGANKQNSAWWSEQDR